MDSERSTDLAGVSLIRLRGRLDAAAAPELRDSLEQWIAAGPPRLLLDLSGVDFVDSRGISALVTGLRLAQEAAGDLALLRPSAGVRRILEITRLYQILAVHEDEATAVRALGGPVAS